MSSSDSLENQAAGGSRCAHSRSRRCCHVNDFPRKYHSDDEKRYHSHESNRLSGRRRKSSRERAHICDDKREHSPHYGSRRRDLLLENDSYSPRRRHRSSDRTAVRDTPTVDSVDAGQNSNRENYHSRRSRYDLNGERNRRQRDHEDSFPESRYADYDKPHRRSQTRDWKSADEFDDDRRHRHRRRVVRIDSDIDVLGKNDSSGEYCEDLACDECGKFFRAESKRHRRERRSSSEGQRFSFKDEQWNRRKKHVNEPNKRSYGGSDSETEFLTSIFVNNRTTASTNQIIQTTASLTENQAASNNLGENETLSAEPCQNNVVSEVINYSKISEPQKEQSNADSDDVSTSSRADERTNCNLC